MNDPRNHSLPVVPRDAGGNNGDSCHQNNVPIAAAGKRHNRGHQDSSPATKRARIGYKPPNARTLFVSFPKAGVLFEGYLKEYLNWALKEAIKTATNGSYAEDNPVVDFQIFSGKKCGLVELQTEWLATACLVFNGLHVVQIGPIYLDRPKNYFKAPTTEENKQPEHIFDTSKLLFHKDELNSRKLFVGLFNNNNKSGPVTMSKECLSKTLSDAIFTAGVGGRILDIQMCTTKRTNDPPCAFVELSTAFLATACLGLNDLHIPGIGFLRVERPKGYKEIPREVPYPCSDKIFDNIPDAFSFDTSKLEFYKDVVLKQQSRRLFVGLPKKEQVLSKAGLADALEDAILIGTRGVPLGNNLIEDIPVFKPKEFAFVEFKSEALATACLALSGLLVPGKGRIFLERPKSYQASGSAGSTVLPLHLDTSQLDVVTNNGTNEMDQPTEGEIQMSLIGHALLAHFGNR